MPRGLSDKFMKKLLPAGEWSVLIDVAKTDTTLLFQIRDNYINVYYRGQSALKLEESGKIEIGDANKGLFLATGNIVEWCEKLPLIKQKIDTNSKISMEREFQQIATRVNSCSNVANDTDYFIVDTELADSENNSRFDMLAIKWPSTPQDRKNGKNCSMSIIEMKYGLDAFDNFKKHFNDINQYNKIDLLKQSVCTQFKQLRELGLIQFSTTGNIML